MEEALCHAVSLARQLILKPAVLVNILHEDHAKNYIC